MEKRESLYIVGGNVNWCSHCGKLWTFLKKLKNKKQSEKEKMGLVDFYKTLIS